MSRGARVEPTPPECAMAAEMFDHFCAAGTMKQILALHREICNTLNLRPNRLPDFYPKLKAKLASSWKAQALFKKFDARANHKVYGKGRACQAGKVLIIGAGPCGLRAAIECQLLGAKVVVVEKRDRISRNNVLHLWPFVIHDLRALGAKKFFGKFCAGSIDHISIRQLQCILMKVSLLLGVEIHEGVGFEELLEPTVTGNSETLGWRARVSPPEHVVSQYEFDALIGADGKRNTLSGFKRKEFRGKLAMAITANFINRHTEQEASVPEISGVAFIFNQKFFKDLYENTGIDLENIVYYKDDTHYFVMTAKKQSLLNKGVLLNDFNDVSRLLSVENVDRAALMRYAVEAARFSTMGRLPLKQFALNHYGEPDVALFDFTSMYAAENASLIYERLGRRLLCQLVGDSLLEPFWPTGSGCARGFLSALDAAWAVRAAHMTPALHPLQILAQREAIYRLLAQTTPENLNRDFGGYTLDPGSRYPNLNRGAVSPARVTQLYDSDDPLPLGATNTNRKRRREVEVSDDILVSWVGYGEGGIRAATSAPALTALLKRYRPDLIPTAASPRAVYHVLQQDCGITPPIPPAGTWRDVPEAKLRSYLARIYLAFKGEVPHVEHRSDVFQQLKQNQQKEKHVRNTADHSVSVYTNAADTDKSHSSYKKKRRSVRSPQEEGRIVGSGSRTAGGGARVARLAAELSGNMPQTQSTKSTKPKDLMRSVGKIERDDWNVREIEKKILENRMGRPEPRTAEKVPKWDREQFLVRQRRLKEGENEEKWVEIDETIQKLDQKLRDSGRPDQGTKKVANLANKFVKKEEPEPQKIQTKEVGVRKWRPAASQLCAICGARVFAAERASCDGRALHRACFKCAVCRCALTAPNYTTERCGSRLVCLRHSGVSLPDGVVPGSVPSPTPERISLELSVGASCEIDEDEWTDRNCLASETSGAGGLSDEDDSSSEEYTDAGDDAAEAEASPSPDKMAADLHRSHLYPSTDSFPYDDYSDDGGDSSGAESCSRMRAAREARRREVPADRRPPTDSSEVESEDESSSSSSQESSATEVSTDSEFRDDPPPPPAILVTEPPPLPIPPAPVAPAPLARTRSAGGIATKRALELKRKYLLGEPSPPAVRKSDSTSQLDTKLEAFRTTISEFQKLLHPAPIKPTVTFQLDEKPMPDIIQNICTDAPVDLLTKIDSPLSKKPYSEPPLQEEKTAELDELESDSLSEDVSLHTEAAPNQSVPRVEVHDEGGELIQLDSLTIINTNTEESDDKPSRTVTITGPTVVAAESESSESCRDVTTLALTETELSDWAAESGVLDDCAFEDSDRKRNKNPRTLSGPKSVHDAKNISTIASHVCGRASPPPAVVYSNALEHFEFADEGEQDPSLETPTTPRNEGYMELVDDYDLFSPSNDRSMNFIERSFETVSKPVELDSLDILPHCSNILDIPYTDESGTIKDENEDFKSDFECTKSESDDLISPQLLKFVEPAPLSEKPRNSIDKSNSVIVDVHKISGNVNVEIKLEKLSLSEASPPSPKDTSSNSTPVSALSSESKSDLFKSDLSQSDVSKTDKSRSELSKNDLSRSDVSKTDKSRSELSKNDLSRSDVSKNDVSMTDVSKNNVSRNNVSKNDVSMTDVSKNGGSKNDVSMTDVSKNEVLRSDVSKIEVSKRVISIDMSPPLELSTPKSPSNKLYNMASFTTPGNLRLYSPAICRSASETFNRSLSRSTDSPARSIELPLSLTFSSGSVSPISPSPLISTTKAQEFQRAREEQTEVVRRLVLERLGSGPRAPKKTTRRVKASPVSNIPPPVPPPPPLEYPPPPPRPAPPLMPLPVTPSFSDPELARDRRRKSIMRSISNYFNRRLGPRQKEVPAARISNAHKSTGALQDAPPVPPRPAAYAPRNNLPGGSTEEVDERDAMQLWFEARWARLVAQRRARDSRDEPGARRVARLERRLARPLSAEQQAATVAELVQVSAQRDAHQALMAANRRRSAASGAGD